jgi:hypothetical protein
MLSRNAYFFPQNGAPNMTLHELIERLEDYRDEIGGDAEVRMMTQQNWPFENSICGLASGQEINASDEDDSDDDGDVEDDQVLYIVQGQQLGYCLAVKGNQPTLHNDLISFFNDHLEDDFARHSVRRFSVQSPFSKWRVRELFAICAILRPHFA